MPVELARRERVLIAGDEGVIFADMGDAGRSAKPVWRFNFWEVFRNSLGIDFSLSSSETGDAERGESRKDMETVRHMPGRMWRLLKECVDGELTSSKPSWSEETQMPLTTINLRSASSVTIGALAAASRKDAVSMLAGVRAGDAGM